MLLDLDQDLVRIGNPCLQDPKADPGVARDVTASLLMPPPPPPPLAESLQGAGGNNRGREENPDHGLKRQRSCSPQGSDLSNLESSIPHILI
ncbi:uncharacterized protein LOC119587105 isoform X2 [Penaeus monodon]|uniref:uncharacterized protein LOC119587105 isoform X2 n=1 Tax=Penaeus monodon TaxID=6687 RepID=UPI0018A7B29C|nr:uncharacterized protein LOC119587105 isoform X2 [Penaeus monodon]